MKKVIIFLIVLYGIISGFNVNALEGSFYEGGYISGEYITKVKDGYKKYKQMREFKRNGDNRLTYCIELWEELNLNKTLSGYDFKKSTYSNLTSSVLDKVILIAYYGYGYPGHTDIKWYVITQFMIWKEISPETDLYFTDTLNGNRITKYEKEMKEIEKLVNGHKKVPTFHGMLYQVNYNEWFTITDLNNYMDRFTISDTNKLEVIKDGNSFKVKSKKIGISDLVFENNDTLYSNYPTVYIDDTGQDLLVTGSYYPYFSTVSFQVKGSKLVVNKLDYDNTTIGSSSLDGAKIELLDSDKKWIDTKEVVGGKVTFTGVGYGKYYLHELKAGLGYTLNNELKEINISDMNVTVNFYNKVIKNKIIINKYLKNPITGINNLEEGAKFIVYDNDKEVKEIITDSEGKIEFELPYGTYKIKQISGNKDYKLSDDLDISVLEDGKIQEFNLYDEGYIFNLKIENLDYDSSKPILESGSSFIIKNLDTMEEIILETNELGVTDTINLTTGNYEIIEKSVVDGYILNEDKIGININIDNYNTSDTIVIPIANKKKVSRMEFSKVIEYYLNDNLTDSKIDNSIEVTVYAKDNIYSKDGVKLYAKDEVVDNVSYDGNNILSKDLVLGNYYVNDLDDNVIDINLDTTDTKKVSFLAKVYEYENNNDTRVIEVDNTLSYKDIFDEFYIILILFGLMLSRGLKHE